MAVQKTDVLYHERSGIGGKCSLDDIHKSTNAADVNYDNLSSGLVADDVQDAIDEINSVLPDTSLSPIATTADAAGSTLGLEQGLLAAAGQPALTVLAVGYTNTGKVQGVSLGDGNTIEVYASGADFNIGNVLYREFMSLGEPICFTGLAIGSIITSTQGFYGACECANGNSESDMPLLSYGLSFSFTFMFGFRSFGSATNLSEGLIHVVNGPLNNVIKITDGLGNTIDGQENIALTPWEYVELHGNGVKEYILEGTNPMMACTNANMDSTQFLDSRLVMPLSNDLISWARNGDFSTPFNNVLTNFYVRDGASGSFTASPGSAYDMNGTGANDADYEPNGATRTKINGLGTWYSGADGLGSEASPAMPVSAMSQVVAQWLYIDDAGDGGASNIAIASPFVGEAKVFEWDDTTSSLIEKYVVPLNRLNVTVTSKEDQNHPSAATVSNENVEGTVTLVGDLKPGVIIANVPITVVIQNATQTQGTSSTLRSQNGTTTTGIQNDDDETLSLGWTPATLKAEITEGSDGILYRRTINSGGGSDTWVQA